MTTVPAPTPPAWVTLGCLAAALATAAVFAITYGPGLGQFFTADDFVLLRYCRDTSAADIVRERLLRGPSSAGTTPWWRPGWLLACNAGYEAFGLAPAALRGIVWAMHAVMAAGVFAVARRCTASGGVAVAAAAVFALAPSYAEALLWVAAGTNVLPAGVCLFVAAVAYARYVETGRRRLLALAWAGFLTSFLFREAAYHVPLVVAAAHLTLRCDLPLARRLGSGALHALPFGAVVVLHNLWLNPFAVGGMTLPENLRIAAGHGAQWLRTLFALPPGPWPVAAAAAAFGIALALHSPRGRFCLLWAVAASFPFVARSHDTRFLYFVHAPLALAAAAAAVRADGSGRAKWLLGPALLAVALLMMALFNATRVPAAVRQAAASADLVTDFLDHFRIDPPAAGTTVHTDFLPPELVHGAPELLDLYLGASVAVANHALLERPPFLIFANPAFATLAEDTPMLHFDHGTRRFVPTTRRTLVHGKSLLPMFAFRHRVQQVGDWADVRFDPTVVHLQQVPPDLDLAGEGTGKVVSVGAGTLSRFDVGVDTARDGYLVVAFLADLTTVGGRAFVDGEPVPLLTADGLFNAVPVRKGSRLVVLKTAL